MLQNNFTKNEIQESWNYWYPLVFGYFYRRVNSRQDVEDLTANTLTALFLNPEVQNPKGFVWQTARNQLYKFIDQKTKHPENSHFDIQNYENSFSIYSEPQNSFVSENTNLENQYSSNYQSKIQELVKCCKNHLEENDYNMICLSVMEEKNSTEIGQVFNLKPATVRQKLKRSFSKLKQRCVQLWLEMKENPRLENQTQYSI